MRVYCSSVKDNFDTGKTSWLLRYAYNNKKHLTYKDCIIIHAPTSEMMVITYFVCQMSNKLNLFLKCLMIQYPKIQNI